MIQIIPAILATSEQEYKEELELISGNQGFEGGWVHIDLMDNKFVQNQSVSAEVIKKYPTSLKIEVHLMVEQPNAWVDQLHEAGVGRLIAHIEIGDELVDNFISQCKVFDIEAGLAIKMDTPLEKLEPYLGVVDLVLVMSIVPGFQGQPFIPESIERIKKVLQLTQSSNKPFIIGVDGHLNASDVKQIVEAGAEHLVVGSFLLKGDIDENLAEIWQAIKS